ncbi:MAG: class I mannose-6-phosphate isomerase [Planctomycetota bacterium]|nr:class I mannose-6-phosphate isomerase [Planctomycetota bacterium]
MSGLQDPIVLTPLLKKRMWGGTRIESMMSARCSAKPIGEAWLVSDLPEPIVNGVSPISHGAAHEVTTLREAIRADPTAWLGSAIPGPSGTFPLLLKILDARENLSVQVHPDARYAKQHPDALMKSEAWVILHHEPGAMIYRGLRPSFTIDALRGAANTGTILKDLIAIPARVGDCHYLPSGICHALGAGITAFEVQTPSDTTFRVFDWNRNDPDRPLHLTEAEECILLGNDQHLDALTAMATPQRGPGGSLRLVANEFFSIDRVTLPPDGRLEFDPSSTPRMAWIQQGHGRLSWPDDAVAVPSGGTFVVAANCVPTFWTAPEGGTILVTTAADGSGLAIQSPAFRIA